VDFFRSKIVFFIQQSFKKEIFYTQKKIFRNSFAAEDVIDVIDEYIEKFFCCTKISFARAPIHSFQINSFGLERFSMLLEEYLRQ
jgi:hypothetical protein